MNLWISFSGGETSAYMTKVLLDRYASQYEHVVVGFANTGEENEQTLDFVRRCDEEFGFGTVWLEAVPTEKSTGHKVVSFHTASRSGEPYEAVIRRYGIPNSKWPLCTRELKQRPMDSYIRECLQWKRGTFHVAIGIRADEPSRRSKAAEGSFIVYPMLDWEPTTKIQINTFWRDMPFRLQLKGYQGNCKWCWKKSVRKLITIARENPEHFGFPERMESLYGRVGAEFRKDVGRASSDPSYRRVFFRGNMTTRDVLELSKKPKEDWTPAENDAVIYDDMRSPCEESCEPTWVDDESDS